MIQAALCLMERSDASAAVGSKTYLPNGALDIAGLKHETQHVDSRVRGFQFSTADFDHFRSPGAGRSSGVRQRLDTAPFIPGGIECLCSRAPPRLRLCRLAF